MDKGMLDRIMLHSDTEMAWMATAVLLGVLGQEGHQPGAEEGIEILPDGRLRLYVSDIDGEIVAQMIVERDCWSLRV